MKKLFSKKKGFTLVEILVVITIAMVLSSLAVNGYIQYRKSALLDLTVDNILSQIGALRSATIYGDVGSARFEEIKAELGGVVVDAVAGLDSSAKCYGVYFEKTGDEYQVSSFEQIFVGKKTWNGAGWVYQGCGSFDPLTQEFKSFELDDQIVIIDVAGLESLVLRFLPPGGELELRKNAGAFESSADSVAVEIQYGLDENFKRTFNVVE